MSKSDPADWKNSRWLVPLGASGHPASPNFADQQLLWVRGESVQSLYVATRISDENFDPDDFDADGNLDVVLAGNLYNAEVETPRNDASFGLFLQGDGQGNFKAQSMIESGLKIVGDVRDMELVSKNGEKHILVAKNDDYLQLIKVNEDSL